MGQGRHVCGGARGRHALALIRDSDGRLWAAPRRYAAPGASTLKAKRDVVCELLRRPASPEKQESPRGLRVTPRGLGCCAFAGPYRNPRRRVERDLRSPGSTDRGALKLFTCDN